MANDGLTDKTRSNSTNPTSRTFEHATSLQERLTSLISATKTTSTSPLDQKTMTDKTRSNGTKSTTTASLSPISDQPTGTTLTDRTPSTSPRIVEMAPRTPTPGGTLFKLPPEIREMVWDYLLFPAAGPVPKFGRPFAPFEHIHPKQEEIEAGRSDEADDSESAAEYEDDVKTLDQDGESKESETHGTDEGGSDNDAQDDMTSKYIFHTNILASSKVIRAEALARMLKMNTFVHVSFRNGGALPRINQMGVGYVVQVSRPAACRAFCSMTISVTSTGATRPVYESEKIYVMLLAEDLPRFALLYRLEMLATRPITGTMLPYLGANGRVALLQYFGQEETNERCALEIATKDINLPGMEKPNKPEWEKQVLKLLKDTIAGAETTFIQTKTNNTSGTRYNTYQRAWLNALSWSTLELLADVQKEFRRLSRQRNHSAIVEISTLLIQAMDRYSLMVYDTTSAVPGGSDTPLLHEVTSRISVIMIDLLVQYFAALLILNRFEAALGPELKALIEFWTDACGMLHSRHAILPTVQVESDYATFEGAYHAEDNWYHLMLSVLQDESSAEHIDELFDTEHTVQRVRLALQNEKNRHDLGMIRNLHMQKQSMSAAGDEITTGLLDTFTREEIVSRLSICQKNDITFKTEAAYDFVVPKGLEGWVDLARDKEWMSADDETEEGE